MTAAALAVAALTAAAQPIGAVPTVAKAPDTRAADTRAADAKAADSKAAHAKASSARSSAAPDRRSARQELGKCGTGELCLWGGTRFHGKQQTYELRKVDIESCTPLPGGAAATSAANRTGRPVTLYQSEECAETAEFNTYPSGSWTPELPYKARAFKVWEH